MESRWQSCVPFARVFVAIGTLLLAGVGVAGSAYAQTPPAVEIAQADNGKTFHVSVGQTVTVRLGTELDWTVTVAPPGILPLAPGVNTLVRGVQAIYRAAQPGTVTVSAEGRPHCNPGQACPQFIQSVKATVVVDAAPGGGPGTVAPTAAPVSGPRPTAPGTTSPGAAATRPAAVAALPNTGTGSESGAGTARGAVTLRVILICAALLGTGALAWRTTRSADD